MHMIRDTSWRNALLSQSSQIREAIKILIDSSLRIVLIVDTSLKLIGTVTDGDIRRGLIRGLNMESPVIEVINRKPIVTPQNVSRDVVLKLMSANKIFQIPIVDEEFRLTGLHLWEELSAPTVRDNVMVIMAGGKGTRLLPKTEKTPKPMLQLGGKPVLEHIINRAKQEGFRRFVLAIHHLGEVIEDYFKSGDSMGVEISYIKEDTPLGTAGALRLLDPRPSEPIIVSNGDVITDIRYGSMLDFHIENMAKATMAVQIHEVKIPYGVIRTNGLRIIDYEEKPTEKFLVNAGVYVIDPDCLFHLSNEKAVNMPSFFESLTSHGLSTLAFLIHENWTDIGGHEEFAKAAQALMNFKEKPNETT